MSNFLRLPLLPCIDSHCNPSNMPTCPYCNDLFSTNGYSVHIALKKPCSELHKARKRKQPSQQRGEIDDPESHGYNDEPVGHAHDDAGHVPHFPSDEPDDSGAHMARNTQSGAPYPHSCIFVSQPPPRCTVRPTRRESSSQQ